MPHRRWIIVALLAALPANAWADDPPKGGESQLDAARALGTEGLELFDKGDYAGALAKLDRAQVVLRAPTLELYAARCLAKLGRLIEAADRYLWVSEVSLAPDAPEAFRRARQDAKLERQQVMARIPTLWIELEGVTPREVAVEFDGTPIARTALGSPTPTDPGVHRIHARAGAVELHREITLAEGEHKKVVLPFERRRDEPDEAAAANSDPSDFPYRPLTWISFGIGGVGLVTGIAAGAVALTKKGDLDDQGCANGCSGAEQSDQRTYEDSKAIATVGLVVGGVGIAAGVALLLATPSADVPSKKGLSMWIGPEHLGVRGRF